MALVTRLVRVKKERPKVHATTTCEASVFEIDGRRYVQIDTFGSASRHDRGQVSQCVQLDARAAEQLRAILNEAFPANR